jgi:hypothetical protein
MNGGNKLITKVKVMLFLFSLTIILFAIVTECRRYRQNIWIPIKENPEDYLVDIDGELANKNSAPFPQMILKKGEAKFLPNPIGAGKTFLGYKMNVAAEMNERERDASKYSRYLYQTRFRFILIDKDGFPLQVLECPKEYEVFEISKSRSYQNVCEIPIGDSVVGRTNSVFVNYMLSAH